MVNSETWLSLGRQLQEIVAAACAAEAALARAETEWRNAEALGVLVREHGVEVRRFPSELLVAARQATEEVMARFTDGSDLDQRIHSSYNDARERAKRWSAMSVGAYLQARIGA